MSNKVSFQRNNVKTNGENELKDYHLRKFLLHTVKDEDGEENKEENNISIYSGWYVGIPRC